ncbi:MAG: formylglycine-generating enzyme family protein, partial [Planctomycetes bacterium]|nr:formylglycine-generating enzyme family protein [Planctomycetota bacterium]
SGFFLDREEVSNRQYARFLEWWRAAGNRRQFSHPDEPAGHDPTPAGWGDPARKPPEIPVTGVDWFSAYAYARWAGKELPTEAQWEKAASVIPRERRKTKFPWGDGPPAEGMGNFGDSDRGPAAVNLFESGRSPFGALNMAGNAAEWCLDAWGGDFLKDLAKEAAGRREPWAVNPVREGLASGPHAVRGGSWKDRVPDLAATRRRAMSGRPEDAGFRCALWMP